MPDDADKNALLAGWHSEDGPAPFEHGEPVEPLGSDTDRAALVAKAKAAVANKARADEK